MERVKMIQQWKSVFVLLLMSTATFAADVVLPPGVVKPQFFDKQSIKVISYQKTSSGLNVWQVEKGLTKTIFYTTQDNKVLMSGVLWDAATGVNLSDVYIPIAVVDAATEKPVLGNFSHDKPSDAIVSVSSLVGIKEGRGAIDKTLYIIFDPRCPHCDAVYKNTREFVKNGGSIKWIPCTVLGNLANGAAIVAGILESKDMVAALASAMGRQSVGKNPSTSTLKAIAANEAYFFAAFEHNRSAGAAGVPVAFFEKQSGEPQMVGSIDDPELLPRILRDIKH